MRVLQLISSGGFFGAENVVLGLSCGLFGRGHEVLVGTFDNTHKRNEDLRVRAAGQGLATRIFSCRGRFDPRTVRDIARCIGEDDVDLVHTHGYKADLYGYCASRLRYRPLLATCHNWIGSSRTMRLYANLDRRILCRFDAVAAVSRPVRDQLLCAGMRPDALVQIDNGIDPDRFAPRRQDSGLRRALGLDEGDVVVGTVGRLAELKGFEDLIEATAAIVVRVPRARLLFVGDGPLRGKFADLARQRGLEERVVFAGIRKDVPELLALIDVFVLPSLQEGQPMALMEAMAAARAVVATRVGDIPEILCGGRQGVLINPSDIGAMTNAVVELLKDDALRTRLGRQARESVLENYTVKRLAERYEKLYQSCTSGNNRRRPGRSLPGLHG